jgi:hypothetical protein
MVLQIKVLQGCEWKEFAPLWLMWFVPDQRIEKVFA